MSTKLMRENFSLGGLSSGSPANLIYRYEISVDSSQMIAYILFRIMFKKKYRSLVNFEYLKCISNY